MRGLTDFIDFICLDFTDSNMISQICDEYFLFSKILELREQIVNVFSMQYPFKC